MRMFYDEHFSKDVGKSLWIQCLQCEGWAHVLCTDSGRDVYGCDFCH